MTNYAGTHLILPPCVSLGGQNINRFACPRNLRLMISIRESCRSIEELDLGGNKLTDLIEVYKILQCTPNLKFLNLSENDLSRSLPVAMATACSSSNSSSSHLLSSSSSSATNHLSVVSQNYHQNWSSSSTTLNSGTQSRSYLAQINQNQQPPQHQASQQAIVGAIGARRHSTLGQSSNIVNSGNQRKPARHPATTRVAEARRLAAANAVAQSKKTSSSVASRLTHSTSSTGPLSSHHHRRHQSNHPNCCPTVEPTNPTNGLQNDNQKSRVSSISSCHQATTASTMHLARSLSSLSAKDVRATSTSLSRLTSHTRSSARRLDSKLEKQRGIEKTAETDSNRSSGSTTATSATSSESSSGTSKSNTATAMIPSSTSFSSTSSNSTSSSTTPKTGACTTTTTRTSNKNKVTSGKLFAEPIVESDDVDMNDQQQVSLQAPNNSIPSSNTNQQQQSKALAMPTALQHQTGNNLSNIANNQARSPSSAATNQFGSSFSISNTTNNQASPNYRRTFESVKALALNNTGCQWRVVCSILSRMPNLEELHLSLNNYERIDLDINEFKHHSLKRLYLCNNPKLTNWEELDKLLIAFPSLEALSIADCNISQIPDNLDRARGWQKLCGLNINGWPIKEWPVIERLNQLPSLIDLKCRNLEVLNTIDEPRHHLIARLPKLQRLNGSEIEEREHAEKAFLRFFMANSHLERPSRFHELVQIHGEIVPVDVDVDLSPPSQAHVRVVYLNRNHYRKENEDDILMSEDFLIKLMDNVEPQNTVVQQQNCLENMEVGESNANNSTQSRLANATNNIETESDGDNKLVRLFKDEGQEVLAIEVDLRQSVRKFKSTLATLFGLDSQNIILYYIDREMVGLMGPELIKHNQKKLWNYNVQDGDQFIVEER